MTLDDQIKNWLVLARWAPSADNSQPWSVDWKTLSPDTASITLTPRLEINSDLLLIQLAVISVGCFFQNLFFLAKDDGYTLEKQDSKTLSFSYLLKKDKTPSPSAYTRATLLERYTERRPYLPTPLKPEDKQAFLQIVNSYSPLLRLHFMDKAQAAKNLLTLDVNRYQNVWHLKRLLNVFRFGSEDEMSGDGLSMRNLAMPKMAEFIFFYIRRFFGLRLLFSIGLQYIFSYLGCAKLILASSEFVLLKCSNADSHSWFELGQCLEHLWLEATQRKVCVHPFGHSLLVYDAQMNPKKFTRSQLIRIEKVSLKFKKLGIDLTRPGLFLRLGYLEGPRQKPVGRYRKNI